MNKKIHVTMLFVLLLSQFAVTIENVTLIASEIEANELVEEESSSEVSSPQADTSSLDSEVGSEEVASEIASETTSETVELASETISEETSVVTDLSEATSSEEIPEDETDSEASNEVEAKITIDEDGTQTKQAKAMRSADNAEAKLKTGENVTTYENQERLEANAGLSTINITPTAKSMKSASDIEDQKVYYVLNDEGQIESGSVKQPRSYDGNLVTVLNGTIIDADSAIARTSGGYDYSFYMYESIEDVQSNTDGVPISGGGFDATYLGSEEVDGIYYDHLKISGYEGYTVSNNIQIVPQQLIKAQSYYIVENGDWVYYSAIDPVTSTSYDRIVLGSAPSDAKTGTKYYSNDDVNFTTASILSEDIVPAVSYNSYFQNLPFRSTSEYSASDYNRYLKAKGKTSSEYYNETNAFTKAQDLENINSMMIFSMANHESAYGTSTYARACYNFFGRGAVDSDPDKACQQYGYNTATDGILAQALFLENGYFDVTDWRYSGTHAGNKASGINVKYASDVDWGKKLSNHAYMIDQYLGSKQEDKYAILKVTGNKNVYTSSSLKTSVKSSSDSASYNTYDLSPVAGTSNTVNVVALQQTSSAYQIYVPTSVKTSNSQDCSYTNSKRGSYPNYGGRSKVSVATNTANYSCDYKSWSNGRFWISKSNTSVINSTKVPNATKYYYTYYSNGSVKMKYYVNSSTNTVNYAYMYDTNGNAIKKYEYYSGTKYNSSVQSHVYKVYYLNQGKLTSIRKYNSRRQLIYVYAFYDGATLSDYGHKIKYRFNLDPATNNIINTYGFAKGSTKKNQILTYFPETTYSQRVGNLAHKYLVTTGTDTMTKSYVFDHAGNTTKVYTYIPNTQYGSYGTEYLKDVFWLKGSHSEIDYSITYRNGERYVKYLYDAGTILGQNHGQHISKKYYF